MTGIHVCPQGLVQKKHAAGGDFFGNDPEFFFAKVLLNRISNIVNPPLHVCLYAAGSSKIINIIIAFYQGCNRKMILSNHSELQAVPCAYPAGFLFKLNHFKPNHAPPSVLVRMQVNKPSDIDHIVIPANMGIP
jgi:hypothetical protein